MWLENLIFLIIFSDKQPRQEHVSITVMKTMTYFRSNYRTDKRNPRFNYNFLRFTFTSYLEIRSSNIFSQNRYPSQKNCFTNFSHLNIVAKVKTCAMNNQKIARICGVLGYLVPFVKNVKNTHGGVLILVTLQAGLRNASHILSFFIQYLQLKFYFSI